MNKNTNISFVGFKPLMEAVHTSETRLIDKLKKHRAKYMHLDASTYVAEWVSFGITIPKKNGMVYSEKWLRDIARDAGIKQRASGGGRKPKTDAQKASEAFERWLAKMPKKLTATQAKAIVKKATASC